MKPMFSARNWSSSLRESELTSLPAMCSVPEVGRSRQPSRFTSVDLPEPDGPMMPSHSPRGTDRETESSARTVPARPVYSRVTDCMSMSVGSSFIAASSVFTPLFPAQQRGRLQTPQDAHGNGRGQHGHAQIQQRDPRNNGQ